MEARQPSPGIRAARDSGTRPRALAPSPTRPHSHTPTRALAFALLVFLLVACQPRELAGTIVDKLPVPAFRLTDALTGQTVSEADLKGTTTIVTFLYATCPDICPVIANKLKITLDELEREKVPVRIVAISTDPDGDTPEAVRKFSDSRRLTGRWHYLIGSKADLGPVWIGYGVGVLTPGTLAAHTDAIWVLDRESNRRVLLRGEFEPADLAEHVKRLR